MSDWYQIESHQVIVQVVTKGAEMKRLFNKIWNRELLWNGDEKIWGRSAPILFPIVGKLKDDEYIWESKTYKMPRHGFARDQEFSCVKCTGEELEFVLVPNKETYEMYPFVFELRVHYLVVEESLFVTYKVINIDDKDIYFSIGAHPAFDTANFKNFEIHFEKTESDFLGIKNDLIDYGQVIPFKNNKLVLESDTFNNDALVFNKLKSSAISLVDIKFKKEIKLKNFKAPYFGIWGKSNNPFVCLEPWHGIADDENHDKELINKKGIVKLSPKKEFEFKFQIELLG